MASATEFDPNPDNNTTIGGLNVGEGCPAANINNAVRYLAAAMRTLQDQVTAINTSNYITKSAPGNTFSDRPQINTQGGIVAHNDPANTSGRIIIVADGTVPSGLLNGDIVIGV